jgi:hypothetical protein
MTNPSPALTGRIALKTATEYPLPANQQTHEIVSPVEGLLLVSQQPGSAMVKMRVDRDTGRPISAVSHVIGHSFAGLHGLCVSRRHPGRLWATLQFTSELLLIDPVADDLGAAPKILQRVILPPPAQGPHVVIEDGDDLWASCKDSHHVVRVRPDDPNNTPSVYPCPPRPIFVAVHPKSKDIYASLDQESAILRIPRVPAEPNKLTEIIRIPADRGATPVGSLPAPMATSGSYCSGEAEAAPVPLAASVRAGRSSISSSRAARRWGHRSSTSASAPTRSSTARRNASSSSARRWRP